MKPDLLFYIITSIYLSGILFLFVYGIRSYFNFTKFLKETDNWNKKIRDAGLTSDYEAKIYIP